nr:helix-turn-helix transcriptional regulator [Streptomyces corchorusii]
MDAHTPNPPPEAALIKEALRRSRLSGREAARRAGMSETRWRQIVNGYQDIKGVRVAVQAPDETLARVAQAVGITSDQLRQVDRNTAADLLDELAAPPTPASTPGSAAINPQIDAIATLLATLPPEAQDEVLRRVGLAQQPAPQKETEEGDRWRRRAG